ncbi:MAG: aminopeptidase P family protein [Deltaproteobacteria bacterium]|nr:aminopeptidase P family protein [Deltaproteobacteria bacterium]
MISKRQQKLKKSVVKRAKHDSATPAALIEFMMGHWQKKTTKRLIPIKNWVKHAARRRRLAQAFPHETLIIPTGREKMRNSSTPYRFRAASDFYYLVGNLEPDCVLVLQPQKQGRHKHVLYVEPDCSRKDQRFFTDRIKGELWVGPRLTLHENKIRYRVDECQPLAELETLLRKLKKRRSSYRIVRNIDPVFDAKWARHKKRDDELATFIAEMRIVKDQTEIDALVQAAKTTRSAFEDIIKLLPKARNERELECAFASRARLLGNDVGYGVIVAAGAHACTLHWPNNDGPISKKDLVLIDAGVESHELYTADVTRTIPASGRFSQTQKIIYELVLSAHLAAMNAVKPGNDFLAPHRAAAKVLAQGLEHLGILSMSAKIALEKQKQYYRRYTLHSTSHLLGLDVHDCDRARQKRYRRGKLETGMVLTIEPGLYFQKDDLTVPKKYRGIGIRIEDDVLVTKSGYRVLTNIPRTVAAVESWIKKVLTKIKKC